jgi:peptidoglycan hydrolase CwlO-like protein
VPQKTNSVDADIENLMHQVQRARDLIKESEQKVSALEVEIQALQHKLRFQRRSEDREK